MSYHKVQPRELHETSHTQSTCGKPGLYWRSWGPATTVFRKFRKFGMQPYLKTKILTPSVFSIPVWGSSQKEMLEVSFFKKLSPKPRLCVSGEKSGSLLAARQSVAHFFLKNTVLLVLVCKKSWLMAIQLERHGEEKGKQINQTHKYTET